MGRDEGCGGRDGYGGDESSGRRFDSNLREQVAGLARVVDSLHSLVDEAPGAAVLELVEEIEVQHRRLAAVRAKVMARAKASGLWAVAGARSFNAWASTRLGGDPAEVGRTVRETAKLGQELPLMETAVAQGSVSPGHVSVLVRALATDKQVAALAHKEVGEAFLVDHAKVLTVPKFRQLVKSWAYHADPDAGDGRWQKNVKDEYLVLAETMDGFHLKGFLSTVNGKLVAKAINTAIGVPPQGDKRTLVERNAHGLTEIADRVLSAGMFMKNATIRPHLNVTVDYSTLKNLLAASADSASRPGGHGTNLDRPKLQGVLSLEQRFTSDDGPTLDDGVMLTAGELAFLACDSTVGRVVFGPESEVLNVGRSRRVVTGAQRRAVEARDRYCQFPGCQAYSKTAEVHHIKHWAAGGETSVENSILLCRFHHQHIHAQKIVIKPKPPGGKDRTEGPSRFEPGHKWAFYAENGALINIRKPHNRKQIAPRPGPEISPEASGRDEPGGPGASDGKGNPGRPPGTNSSPPS